MKSQSLGWLFILSFKFSGKYCVAKLWFFFFDLLVNFFYWSLTIMMYEGLFLFIVLYLISNWSKVDYGCLAIICSFLHNVLTNADWKNCRLVNFQCSEMMCFSGTSLCMHAIAQPDLTCPCTDLSALLLAFLPNKVIISTHRTYAEWLGSLNYKKRKIYQLDTSSSKYDMTGY